jgi:hypothetical protein
MMRLAMPFVQVRKWAIWETILPRLGAVIPIAPMRLKQQSAKVQAGEGT